MDLLKQCEIWHENDEYQKIIDALEALPEEDHTPETDSELARAYNNLADHTTPEGKAMLRKAIALLKPHEEHFQGDHCWNFRMGYAYFFLYQEGIALRYFEKALKLYPGDDPKLNTKQDIERLIGWCEKGIALPQFSECFRERTENWWETFAEMEAELRQMMDEDKDHTRSAEIVAQMEDVLHLAFEDISFEMGFNGEKHELILTPEGDKVKLFELVYFRRHAPASVLEHWNILVGRQPNPNMGLRSGDWEIDGGDVQVWVEKLEGNSVGLTVYCEKLLPLLQKEENRAEWMLFTITDNVLGEINAMLYIDYFDVAEECREEPSILLDELPKALTDMGLDLSITPEAHLENSYTGYKMEPNEDPDADWRLDVMAGSTSCPALINEYLKNESGYMDALHADGVAAGFLCYPLDGFAREDRSDKIFAFRDKLEAALNENAGAEALTLTGGATGVFCGYLDFIAWDLEAVLQAAKEFFADAEIPWANFHTFRRGAAAVQLKKPDDHDPDGEEPEDNPEDGDPLDDLEYIPYTPENADAFYQQLEQWNDEDEYTRCIKVLDAIPEELRNYRTAYALARALENYAIIGDHDKGTPSEKGDQALLRAISVLESVRKEGQDKAEWNMRMAYGYQYLYGQEEKAIPYARRWAELDPEDENAPVVIRECQAEITKQAETVTADESDHTGIFTGFVLLSKGEWDKEQLIRDLKEKWDLTAQEDGEDERDDALVFQVGDMIAAVSLMPAPIPDGEAETNAQNNYMWPEAVEAARAHKAHVMVAVLGKEENLLEKGRLYAKLLAACCRQKYATGVYTSGVVFEPRFYEGFADMMRRGKLPIFNWIWFGLYRSEGGMNAYTYGMEAFGREEMEVLNTDAEPGDLRDFLASLAAYVLESGVELRDGETIGFSAGDKHAITRSEGVSLPGITLKISYEQETDGPENNGSNTNQETAKSGNGNLEINQTEGFDPLMDDGAWHLESICEKELPVEKITAYNHMAIYLRWCMEHNLMSEDFLKEYGDLVKQVKADPAAVDLRAFIRDELGGQLLSTLFAPQGQRFAGYYYGDGSEPYFPADIDDYSLTYFGPARYHSDEFQEEAYLYIPFDEDYYQAMALVIDERFANWQGQDFDEGTLEPSDVAKAIMEYLDCECEYFPSMKDDDPIMSAYSYAQRLGVREGFIPVLVKPDETLLECLVMNADPENRADCYEFDLKTVAKYRKKMLAQPVKDGKAVLSGLIGDRKEEAEDDDMDWEEEILGAMEGGDTNDRFSSYWDHETDMTYPLILAKIPVKNPWEIFAYLPFGNWNDCPDTPELMAAAKYWFEQYGAVSAAMTHDELEFIVPAPIPKERAMELAVEQYGFCPDQDQGEEGSIGTLADTLWQSTVWYFWWD